MSFSDFLKPRWQHSKSEVRIRAVNRVASIDLDRIAAKTEHEDVFLAAINRIADVKYSGSSVDRFGTDNRLYDLLSNLEKGTASSRLSSDVIRQRQKNLVGRIVSPNFLFRIVSEFRREIANDALHKLNISELVKHFCAEQYISTLSSADYSILSAPGKNGTVDAPWTSAQAHLAIWRRLDESLTEAVQRNDWQTIKSVIPLCDNIELQRYILLRLPGKEITCEHLRTLCVYKAGWYMPIYHLMIPFLKKMTQDGWQILEKLDETRCPVCGNGDFPGYVTHYDGSSYGCGLCDTKGRIQAWKISGRLHENHFELFALSS